MYNYATDDVIIILEFLKNVGPLYQKMYRNPDGSLDMTVWKRENKLIRCIADTERVGFNVDIDYLIKSHYKVQEFQTKLYDKLYNLTGERWSVGQHKTIMQFFNNKYNLGLESCDKKVIGTLCHSDIPEVAEIAKLIKKLRKGKLDEVYDPDYYDRYMDLIDHGSY